LRDGPIQPNQSNGAEFSERHPQVARTNDGGLILAYLREERNRRTWQLHVAPIEIDEETGDPSVAAEGDRTLTEGCLAVAPVFSPDARWVTGVLEADPPPRTVRRFAVGRDDVAIQ
jgi:hypothetical protein